MVVYLVTVMHSMQAGYMDKAQKYSDKALTQIARLTGERAAAGAGTGGRGGGEGGGDEAGSGRGEGSSMLGGWCVRAGQRRAVQLGSGQVRSAQVSQPLVSG